MTLKERCIRYAMKVECDRCGGEVYPSYEAAEEYVEVEMECTELRDIDDFLSVLERMCDYCQHIMEKDC